MRPLKSVKSKFSAPDFALVFLTSESLSKSDRGPATTFATTAYAKLLATATINPSVLATSNREKDIAAALTGMSSSLGIAHAPPSTVAVLQALRLCLYTRTRIGLDLHA